MFLPHVNNVKVPEDKVRKYLLSSTHPMGKGKAALFIRFGFTAEKWQELAAELESHARENPVANISSTEYGVRYVIDGLLRTPNNSALNIRGVWFITRGIEVPRFVTAHPLKRIAK
ncbi:MAG: DUF6883 domain-containing protein [Burkholderiales bacterium]